MLSEEEKQIIYKNNKELKNVKRIHDFFKKIIGVSSFILPTWTSIIITLTTNAPIMLLLGTVGLTFGACFVAGGLIELLNFHSTNRTVKGLTNGKLNYKQYKKMLKSGEIDRIVGKSDKSEEISFEYTGNLQKNKTNSETDVAYDNIEKQNKKDERTL